MTHQAIALKLPVLQERFPGTKLAKLSRFEEETWKPPLYDIWKAAKNANEVKHFGTTPAATVLYPAMCPPLRCAAL